MSKEALADIALIIALTVLLVSVSNFARNITCKAEAEQIGTQHKYSFLGGCSFYHKPSGTWVPRDNYRAAGD